MTYREPNQVLTALEKSDLSIFYEIIPEIVMGFSLLKVAPINMQFNGAASPPSMR